MKLAQKKLYSNQIIMILLLNFNQHNNHQIQMSLKTNQICKNNHQKEVIHKAILKKI